MTFALVGLAFVGGYVVAAFSWDWLHGQIIGAEAKIDALRDKARALEATLRS